jgi:hypothetical protein
VGQDHALGQRLQQGHQPLVVAVASTTA